MKCCGNCFGDKFLSVEIERISTESGQCSYCDAISVPIISPSKLVDLFEQLIDTLYKENGDSDSYPLLGLLKTDWDLLGSLTDAQSNQLINTIVPELGSKRYKPVVVHGDDPVIKWDALREELKHENRFFPKNMTFDIEHEGKIFGYLSSFIEPPNNVYRARLLMEEEPYEIDQMGKPPHEIVSNGRANPMGIPYLYVATNEQTAVAEIRPFKSATVCVATFSLTRPLTCANFCDPPRSVVSPFLLLGDEEGLRLLRKYMPFVDRMGAELSKPVSPHKSHLEYLPSQYLCEFLKRSGFDGVVYKSSVESGLNYAIFNDASLDGTEVRTCKVDEVRLITSSLT